MNKELLRMVELVALEKGLPQDDIVACLEKAMAGVFRKGLEEGADVQVKLVSDTFMAWRVWEVVADDVRLEDPARQIRLMDALEVSAEATAGQIVKEYLGVPTLTRVAARMLYQQLIGHVRQAERDRARQAWEARVGEMSYGTVKRVLSGRVILDVEGTEATLSRVDQIAGERLRVGARVPLIIRELNAEGRGAPLIACRRSPRLLEALLTRETPEIQSGLVRIRAVARDGRGRAKVAVEASSGRVDAVAACVGMRGARIQAVARDLADERIHLMTWTDSPWDLAIRALEPAQVMRVVVDETDKTMDVAVADEDLGRVQGRWNTGANLMSQLTGWAVALMTEQALAKKQAEEVAAAVEMLSNHLEVDDDLARALVSNGFLDLEAVAFCQPVELALIEGLDEEVAEEIQTRAKTALMAQSIDEQAGSDGLWESLDLELRRALAGVGVHDSHALAECAVDDIQGVGGLDAHRAAELILEARKPWILALESAQASPSNST